MTVQVKENSAIEGAKVSGKSRKPLVNRGVVLVQGHLVHMFSSSFNVEAYNKCALYSPPLYEPNASVLEGDSIICDGAVLYSEKGKYSTVVTMGSGTHQTNKWDFPHRTSARINIPHQELINGLLKREEEQRIIALPHPTKALR